MSLAKRRTGTASCYFRSFEDGLAGSVQELEERIQNASVYHLEEFLEFSSVKQLLQKLADTKMDLLIETESVSQIIKILLSDKRLTLS